MTTLSDIGRDLVVARRVRGISQRALGELVGATQPQIARWEATEYRTTSLVRIEAVADALGYEVDSAISHVAESPAAYRTVLPGAEEIALVALTRTHVPPGAIAAFARSHGIERIDLFGSVLTKRFGRSSDIDVLVTYPPDRTPSLFELADHETELAAMFRRPVDLITRAGVESGRDSARKRRVLESAKTLYARP